MSQQALADAIGVHVTQVGRYEAGNSQPTLEVLRKMARALAVSADTLVFDEEERRPGEEFNAHLQALARLDDEARDVVKTVLEGLLLKYEAKRWSSPPG